ncbi:hypothetical protein FKW77_007689 [Venturia effusa]|uniref:Extracellular membrane protein CFEM domain-containing protein n=1 Tax=Venturia effusa TaxID=50376 RepID=A0A517LKJ4_9PEZI|nr:hypothetical protein FKW77_007689 [Venturia effusa]
MKFTTLAPAIITLLHSTAYASLAGVPCCQSDINLCKSFSDREGCVKVGDRPYCVVSNKDPTCIAECKAHTKPPVHEWWAYKPPNQDRLCVCTRFQAAAPGLKC